MEIVLEKVKLLRGLSVDVKSHEVREYRIKIVARGCLQMENWSLRMKMKVDEAVA